MKLLYTFDYRVRSATNAISKIRNSQLKLGNYNYSVKSYDEKSETLLLEPQSTFSFRYNSFMPEIVISPQSSDDSRINVTFRLLKNVRVFMAVYLSLCVLLQLIILIMFVLGKVILNFSLFVPLIIVTFAVVMSCAAYYICAIQAKNILLTELDMMDL